MCLLNTRLNACPRISFKMADSPCKVDQAGTGEKTATGPVGGEPREKQERAPSRTKEKTGARNLQGVGECKSRMDLHFAM